MPPLELVPFGRQPQRFHHRGIHHHREQGFTNHQKVNGHEENQEITVECILETPRQKENAGGKAQRLSGWLAAEDTQAHRAGNARRIRRACPLHLRQSRL